MRSREYNKRVAIYEAQATVQNPFGGTSAEPVLIATSWAKLETKGVGRKLTYLGIQEFDNPVLFNVRFRKDLVYQGKTLFLVYDGKDYVIKSIRNIDEANRELEIYCVR